MLALFGLAATPEAFGQGLSAQELDRLNRLIGKPKDPAQYLQLMVMNQVGRCWKPAEQWDKGPTVQVEVFLARDGRLSKPPRILNASSDPNFVAAANIAVRAIENCAPYNLPDQAYVGGWDRIVMTFTIGRAPPNPK
jgi:hypothetical protein